MPLQPIGQPYVLQSVDLLEVSGLEIIAIKTYDGSPQVGDAALNNCGPGVTSWPPADVAMRDVAGTTVGASQTECAAILVGLRLPADSSAGHITGMRITYVYEGAQYVVDQRWTFELPSTRITP